MIIMYCKLFLRYLDPGSSLQRFLIEAITTAQMCTCVYENGGHYVPILQLLLRRTEWCLLCVVLLFLLKKFPLCLLFYTIAQEHHKAATLLITWQLACRFPSAKSLMVNFDFELTVFFALCTFERSGLQLSSFATTGRGDSFLLFLRF